MSDGVIEAATEELSSRHKRSAFYERIRTSNSIVWPLFVALAIFMIVAGPAVLIPNNIAWLDNGDAATNYLGWQSYRDSPWTWPPFYNPGFGAEFAQSIVYSDSIPIAAIIAKAINPFMPQPFQFFGYWMLACVVLQSVFAWKLVGLFERDLMIRVLCTALITFAPALIMRFTSGMFNTAHLSLASHFLILASLYECLRPSTQRRPLVWLTLIAVSLLTHAYMFAMVGMFWVAGIADASWRRQQTWRRLLPEVAAAAATISIIWEIAGYGFSNSQALGYGTFKANVLTFFDPMYWSYTMPWLGSDRGEYEGLAFLGMPMIVLGVVACLPYGSKGAELKGFLSRTPVLFFALVGSFLFAVSHVVGIGFFEFELPAPEPLIEIGSIFRASGRMAWPLYYAFVLMILFVAVRSFKREWLPAILATTLLVQIVDSHAGWRHVSERLRVEASTTWDLPFKSPFWAAAAEQYDIVRFSRPHRFKDKVPWRELSSYALNNGLQTDAVYQSRWDEAIVAELNAAMAGYMETGTYPANTMFVLAARDVEPALANLDRSKDLFAEIDGFKVIAPGWFTCGPCVAAYGEADWQLKK